MSARLGIRSAALTIASGMALVAGLALAAGAQAQARQEEKANIVVTGDVKAVDPIANTITIKGEHDDQAVRYDVEPAASMPSCPSAATAAAIASAVMPSSGTRR